MNIHNKNIQNPSRLPLEIGKLRSFEHTLTGARIFGTSSLSVVRAVGERNRLGERT